MIVLRKGGTPCFAEMSVDLHLILLELLKAMGQPCSPYDKKDTDPDMMSGVREGELVSPSPLLIQICTDCTFSFSAQVPETACRS